MKNEPTPPDREVLTGLVERVTYPGYAELVGMKVDVIVVRGAAPMQAAKAATHGWGKQR